MSEIWIYSILSVIIVSLISLVGLFTISIKIEKLKNYLLYLVSFSAGALLGGAFLHLLPEIVEEIGFTTEISLLLIGGILFSFMTEKFIRWRHCHIPTSDDHPHPIATMNLVGDAVHNFMDGLIIAGSYLVSIQAGIATTMAVVFHEIPQEIGDFGVLLHAGYSRKKALIFNFLSALTAVLGAIVALVLSSLIENITHFIVPFAAGMFVYISCSDLIPELQTELNVKKSVFQVVAFILGVGIMLWIKMING